jgi:membrane associated rhomboid family serine protease
VAERWRILRVEPKSDFFNMNVLRAQTPLDWCPMMPRPPALREPMFNLPRSVLVTVLVLLAIHAVRELLAPENADVQLILDLAVIPARWTVAWGNATLDDVLREIARTAGQNRTGMRALAHYVLGEGETKPWTALTYALLHGSWTHVILNTVWLAAFGTPVARRCGTIRFLALALIGAAAGAALHVFVYPLQVVPMIGASAAVSAMVAAAAWFVFARPVWMLAGRVAEPHERPRETLASMVRNRGVVIFVVLWFAINLLTAYLARPLGITDASIAWEAHVGGFLAGLLLFPLIDPKRSGSGTA